MRQKVNFVWAKNSITLSNKSVDVIFCNKKLIKIL